MRTVIAGCILCILLMVPTGAWAVHPFEVEDTDTQGKGNYLFELNGDYLKDNAFRTTNLTGVITAGASQNTDFSLEVPYLMLNPSVTTDRYEGGIGDILLKLKYRTNENEVKQSSGFEIYTSLPVGSVKKGLGTNNVVTGFQIMDQQGCCDTIYHVSAGYEVVDRDTKRYHFFEDYAFRYGFAVEHKITESFRLLAELAGESRKTTDKESNTWSYSQPFTFMAGFKYDISTSWYVDLAGRAGLNKYAEDYAALAGMGWKF